MAYPADLKYTKDHEWIRINGDTAEVGITDYAQQQLGDVVYVDLPEAGSTVTAGETCGEIESTKSVSDLYSPVTGTVVEVNDAVADNPGVVNEDPYGNGWLFTVEVSDEGPLLSAQEYAEANGGELA
jgi:glycine cleavage system H protein